MPLPCRLFTRTSTRRRTCGWVDGGRHGRIAPGSSAAVVRVDLHVLVAEIAGPHRGGRIATVQVDTHGDLALRHHALAVFLAVVGMPPAFAGDMHVVEEQVDRRL